VIRLDTHGIGVPRDSIGVPRDSSGYDIRTAPLFQTGDEGCAWLNNVQAIGIGGTIDGGVDYQIDAVEEPATPNRSGSARSVPCSSRWPGRVGHRSHGICDERPTARAPACPMALVYSHLRGRKGNRARRDRHGVCQGAAP
jgi:hypothetical protein